MLVLVDESGLEGTTPSMLVTINSRSISFSDAKVRSSNRVAYFSWFECRTNIDQSASGNATVASAILVVTMSSFSHFVRIL